MCAAIMLWVSEAPARSYEKPQLCQARYQISSVGYKRDWRFRGPSSGVNDKKGLDCEELVNPTCLHLAFLAAKPLPREWESLGVPQYNVRKTAFSSSLQ